MDWSQITPATFGANSLFQLIYWIAGGVLAFFAYLSLRQRVRSARASFLLQLEERWEAVNVYREKTVRVLRDIQRQVLKDYPDLKDQHRRDQLRLTCLDYVSEIEKTNEILFREFIAYLNFYEVAGRLVKNKYVLYDDIWKIYKGPILDVEIMFRLHIEEWQKRAYVADGLFENMLYLADRTRQRQIPFFRRWSNRIMFWRS